MKTLTFPIDVADAPQVQFTCFDSELSLGVAQEIFAGRTYPLPLYAPQAKTVVDIGANVGAATLHFWSHYPKATYYCFEPNPEAFKLLKGNTTSIANCVLLPFGLSDRREQVTLFHGRDDSVQASRYHTGEVTLEHYDTVTLEDTCEALRRLRVQRIDILKIDTEGCEIPILRSLFGSTSTEFMPFYAARIPLIYVEYHSDNDRRHMDSMLSESHILWYSKSTQPHRGELCYAKRTILPDKERAMEIRR